MSKNSRKTKRNTEDDSDSIEINPKRMKHSDSVEVNPEGIKDSSEEDTDKENDNVIGSDTELENISEQLLSLERKLAEELGKIKFRLPIEYIYSPLEYAFNIHSMYVQKYCNTHKKILFLGMNPGPWGMSQTGVPFGEIKMVRDWLKISGPVGKPSKEQPDRKVTGFECTRSEVSGKRLWGLFQELCGTPKKFFEHSYIHNYCPIALMDKKGRNITPAEIKGLEIQTLHSACDKALADTIKILKAEIVIGIGGYAEKRAQFVVNSYKLPAKVLLLPHPSPRAANNKNWSEKATKKLSELGLLEYFKLNMNTLSWMDVALQKADDSLKAGEVPVGCLFLYNNEVIATGNNIVNETHNATRHAEINCIDQVLEYCRQTNLDYKKVFRDIDVIVTVEPCIMCTSALYQLQVRNIIYGCPNDRFGGCVSVFEVPKLYQSHTTIMGGVKGDEAMALLKQFYKGTNPNAPEVKVKKNRKKKET